MGVVTLPVGEGEPTRAGSSGNLANWTDGPTYSSGSSISVRSCRESDVFDDVRAAGERVGLIVVGLVPERFRYVSGGVTLVVTIDGGCVLLRS